MKIKWNIDRFYQQENFLSACEPVSASTPIIDSSDLEIAGLEDTEVSSFLWSANISK